MEDCVMFIEGFQGGIRPDDDGTAAIMKPNTGASLGIDDVAI